MIHLPVQQVLEADVEYKKMIGEIAALTKSRLRAPLSSSLFLSPLALSLHSLSTFSLSFSLILYQYPPLSLSLSLFCLPLFLSFSLFLIRIVFHIPTVSTLRTATCVRYNVALSSWPLLVSDLHTFASPTQHSPPLSVSFFFFLFSFDFTTNSQGTTPIGNQPMCSSIHPPPPPPRLLILQPVSRCPSSTRR